MRPVGIYIPFGNVAKLLTIFFPFLILRSSAAKWEITERLSETEDYRGDVWGLVIDEGGREMVVWV